ncbi:site-2 protease family protein [Candidatus Parcubacteria bacterium]|nr:site-2 protease family protein [Candidatus Parcubacteria bacterium]
MDVLITVFSLIILLFSVIIHELAHGYVADSLGDPTAKYAGRLTLNPIPHLDLFGSVILPLLLFISTGGGFVVGWAKPVPVNPYNFRDQQWGSLKVAIAGPLTNFALALIFGIFVRFVPETLPALRDIFSLVVLINLGLGIFNLVPIPPLDGSWILFRFIPYQFEGVKTFLGRYGVFILIFLIFFGGLEGLSNIRQLLFHFITGV